MRRLFLPLALLLVCAAASVTAQERPPLTPDQEAALYGLPVFITLGGTLLLVNVADEHDVQYLILAMPLVAGAAACGTGRLTGAPGSCRGALLGGALGALPGLALMGTGAALGVDIFDDSPGIALLLLGAVAYVLVPPFTALDGYRRGAHVAAAPALLSVPEERGPAPGLALRARF